MQRCIVQSSGHRAARGGACFMGPNPGCLPRSSRCKLHTELYKRIPDGYSMLSRGGGVRAIMVYVS